MLSIKSNKELVEAGHQFAKALDADMPLTDIAKLVSALSTRLDCAIVRGDEWEKRAISNFQACAEMDEVLRTVSAENSVLSIFIEDECFVENKRTGIYQCAGHHKPLTPATDAYLNSVRAEGVAMFAEELGSPYGDYDNRDYETGFNRAIEVSKNKAIKFANQLRSGTHDTADKAGAK
ncbi:hypothetical protein C7420_101682 [Pantoea ananatis]|uniref:hypothetical protein n=1 Tax=Pantoea ananas TaxID=553 RepID=UPI000DC44C51|nr:hypothetical protein [Pantoea ananatis]RAR75066.1 hypothetical protein C7420_101682 [Pantoea ananatis]